jgi:hypothetical protein
MPKYVYVQLAGTAAPVKILADEAEIDFRASNNDLNIKKGGENIGSFRGDAVLGWWYEDTPPVTPPADS